jgi:GTP-binding protein LepA
VDFTYEVSRSLAACEGAILVVDATQGIQAQTIANLQLARSHNLTIIPVLNKIDLDNARIEEVTQELESLGFTPQEMIHISAKSGLNVDQVLEAVVTRVSSPKGNPEAPLRALIFSSHYDTHKGVVVMVRVVDGSLGATGHVLPPIRFMNTKAEVNPIEVGYFVPKMQLGQALKAGEVGYIATGLKDIKVAKVGDTITLGHPTDSLSRSETEKQALASLTPLAGYKEPKSMVFLGLFPVASDEIEEAREAMERLQLSDSAFTFRPISSLALGNGFHCGFLGLLHAEVVQERLLREFNLTLLATAPSVEYRLKLKDGVSAPKIGIKSSSIDEEGLGGNWFAIQSASEYPDPTVIEEVREPIMQLEIFAPSRFVGPIMSLCQDKRGEYIDLVYIGGMNEEGASGLAKFTYLIPLSEMIVDFFDRLKSATEGYASLDYEFFEYQKVDVVKVDILVNKEKVDAFSSLVVKEQALFRARDICERLAKAIPKQQFEVPIQGAIGGQVIARSDVKAFRKDVIGKLYGGDRTRKDKLLDKQKKGKAKMKMVGRVEIPQAAFFAVLKKE